MHAGPSSYCADNQASKPPRGRKGRTERVAKKRVMPRAHEVKAKGVRRKRGFGKIATTGQPRFTRHSQF